VQSGATVKVSVASLTVGRPVQAAKLVSDDGTNGRWTLEQAGASNNLQSATTGFAAWKTATLQANPSGANMTWDTSGNTTVGVGNLIIGTSGKGIDFSATPGTGTSELLNDYEEGTWTPTYIGATTAGTTSYATQTGQYTKIGRQVTLHFDLDVNSATGTGNALIGGLPFTCAYRSTGAMSTNFFDWSGGSYVAPFAETSATNLIIFGMADNAPWTTQQVINENFAITGTITYIT
jgi:hypothetical protein